MTCRQFTQRLSSLLQVREYLIAEEAFLQGFDRMGHPILISDYQKHFPKDIGLTRKFVSYTLDTVEAMGRLYPEW